MSLSRTDATNSSLAISRLLRLRFETMTGRRRPRRGQNGSSERLICSLAVIIAVLFVSYWYDGGDEDAATENTGKYEPVLSGAVQSKKLAAVPGSFDLS